MRAGFRDMLAPLVGLFGEDLICFKGPVASQVAFLECRSREAVERASARHRPRRFSVRLEETPDPLGLVWDVDRPPAVRRMASMQYPLMKLMLAEMDVSHMLFVRKGSP